MCPMTSGPECHVGDNSLTTWRSPPSLATWWSRPEWPSQGMGGITPVCVCARMPNGCRPTAWPSPSTPAAPTTDRQHSGGSRADSWLGSTLPTLPTGQSVVRQPLRSGPECHIDDNSLTTWRSPPSLPTWWSRPEWPKGWGLSLCIASHLCVSLEPGWSRDHSGPLVRPIKRGGIILARGRAGRGIFFWPIKNGGIILDSVSALKF